MAILTVNTISGALLATGLDGESIAEILVAQKGDVDFISAALAGQDLHGLDLSEINLSQADLYGADLTDTDLTDADLSAAVLVGATLTDAVVEGTDFTGAILNNVVYPAISLVTEVTGVPGLIASVSEGSYDGSLSKTFTIHIGKSFEYNQGLVKDFMATIELDGGATVAMAVTPIIAGNKLNLTAAGISIMINAAIMLQANESIWPLLPEYRVEHYAKIDCEILNYLG